MTLLALTMLLRGLYFVPGIVSNGMWLAFIMVIFLGVAWGAVNIKLAPFSKMRYLYCILMLISEMVGGYFAINTTLLYLQFAIFIVLIVNFEVDNVENGLPLYFRYLKPLIYFSIGYSLVGNMLTVCRGRNWGIQVYMIIQIYSLFTA